MPSNEFGQEEIRHMTDDEAKAIVDLWAQRQQTQELFAARTSTADLAEVLHISEADVRRMLDEVRANKIMNAYTPPVAPPQVRDQHMGSRMMLGLAIGLVLLATLVVGGIFYLRSSAPPAEMPAIAVETPTPVDLAPPVVAGQPTAPAPPFEKDPALTEMSDALRREAIAAATEQIAAAREEVAAGRARTAADRAEAEARLAAALAHLKELESKLPKGR